MPVAGAVGVPAGRVLTVLTSANRPYAADTFSGVKFVVNTANAVFDGYQFNHLVEVRAPGVVFRNCSFRGPNTEQRDSGLLLVTSSSAATNGAPILVEDSTFAPQVFTMADGVRGSWFTLRRVEITGTIDGVHIHGSADRNDPKAGNVRIESSWIHDLNHVPQGTGGVTTADGSHNDGVQFVGGHNVTITGTRIDGAIYNAGIMMAKDRNDIYTVNISNNWLGGGAATINVADKTYTPVQGLVMNNNVFFRGTTRLVDFAMLIANGTRAIATATGNTWHDNSTPTPYMRNGG